jgi:hypothetical protein
MPFLGVGSIFIVPGAERAGIRRKRYDCVNGG